MSTVKNTVLRAVPLDHPANRKMQIDSVLVTPKKAAEFLGANQGNRNMRKAVIATYARDMAAGDWMTTGDSIKFDWNGRLIDGQHRLEAILAADTPVQMVVVKGLEPRVQDVLDVNSRRSAADALRFNGVLHNVNELAGAARIAKARALGIVVSASSAHTPVTMSNSEVLSWIHNNPGIVPAAALARRTYKTIGATPSALTYCIWELEKIDPVAAVEFFTSTADFRTDGRNDPRSTLLRAFNTLRERKQHMTAGVQILYIFRAWNAWRDGEPLGSLFGVKRTQNGEARGVMIPEPH